MSFPNEQIMTATEMRLAMEADRSRVRELRTRLSRVAEAVTGSITADEVTAHMNSRDLLADVQAPRMAALRAIEADAIAALPGCEQRARQTLRSLGPAPAPRLSPEDQERFPGLAERANHLVPALSLTDLDGELRSTIHADDRAARLAWSLAAQRRIDAERDARGGHLSDALERLSELAQNAATFPRPTVTDPYQALRTGAAELAEESRKLLSEIDTARKSRGERSIGHDYGIGQSVVPFPDRATERRDPSGYFEIEPEPQQPRSRRRV